MLSPDYVLQIGQGFGYQGLDLTRDHIMIVLLAVKKMRLKWIGAHNPFVSTKMP